MKQYGLPSFERIKSKKDFECIFKDGNVVYSSDNKIKVFYLYNITDKNCGVKFAVAVYKKSGNAVWRNRVKRLIRTAYRLNNKQLKKTCSKKKILVKIVFSLNTINQKKAQKIKLSDLNNAVTDIIHKVNSKFCAL